MASRRMIPRVCMASSISKTTNPAFLRLMPIAMLGCRWTLGLVASARQIRVTITGRRFSLRTHRRIEKGFNAGDCGL